MYESNLWCDLPDGNGFFHGLHGALWALPLLSMAILTARDAWRIAGMRPSRWQALLVTVVNIAPGLGIGYLFIGRWRRFILSFALLFTVGAVWVMFMLDPSFCDFYRFVGWTGSSYYTGGLWTDATIGVTSFTLLLCVTLFTAWDAYSLAQIRRHDTVTGFLYVTSPINDIRFKIYSALPWAVFASWSIWILYTPEGYSCEVFVWFGIGTCLLVGQMVWLREIRPRWFEVWPDRLAVIRGENRSVEVLFSKIRNVRLVISPVGYSLFLPPLISFGKYNTRWRPAVQIVLSDNTQLGLTPKKAAEFCETLNLALDNYRRETK